MNFKRFILRGINVIIASVSFLFFSFVGFCITVFILVIKSPSSFTIVAAFISILASFVPAFFLTRAMVRYFRKQQLPPQEDPVEPIEEEPSADAPNDSNATSEPEPAQNPEPEKHPEKEWDPADDIPDIVHKEYFSDTLFLDAVDIILESRIVSAGRLQSALKIGSIRATKILKEMEELGVIGPVRGNLPREIFFTPEEWKTERKRFVWFPEFPDDPAFRNKNTNAETTTVNAKINLDPIIIVQQQKESSCCHCSRCGGNHISYNTVVEKEEVGCFVHGLLFLLMLIMFGLIIGFFVGMIVIGIFMYLARPKTVTYAVCQDCGMRWRTS